MSGQAEGADSSPLIRQHQALEQELTRERDRLRLVLEVNNAVASNLELRELLNSISVCLHRVIHHDAAALTLYDEESGKLRLFALDKTRMVAAPFEEGFLIPVDDNPTGLAYTTRAPVLVDHIDFKKFSSPLVQRAFAGGIRSGCTVPLISHDKVLGVLSVVSTRESAFTQEDAELLSQVGKQIAIAVENALAFREIESLKNKLADEKLYLEEEIQTAYNFEQIIGQSTGLKQVLRHVETAAPTDSTILVLGETGTGKELIARAIHGLSARRERTMVKLNCSAIPTGLLESELFGHEKGAFTGAIAQRIGRFELAHRGSLFLDEVGDIPLELQPKLLRVLQEQEFERLGSAKTIRVDVRLIAATNCDLPQMVAEKKFRSDLYYRLNVFPITIPPLRERAEDIPLLVRFFAQTFARRMRKRIETVTAESVSALTSYSWPGNIRELQNFIERAVILSKGPVLDIPLSEIQAPAKAPTTNGAPQEPAAATLEDAEREHILRVLRETDWVIGGASGAAARLGLKRTTLQSRMRKLGINRSN